MRRLIRDISSVLLISGAVLLLDAGLTLVWQEPLTAGIALIKRSEVDKHYLSYRSAPLSQLDRSALGTLSSTTQRIAYLARREQRQLGTVGATGDAIGSIAIGRIGASFDVIQGTDESSLQKGPGHYPGTSLPGLGQTVGIAGHRTTYLEPFRKIDQLRPGDQIVLTMRYAKFTYVVQYTKIVLPTALWVVDNVGYERLVLSACNPLYSAAQRIIVFARLQEVQPGGAARPVA